ncbi:cytochrome c [Pseudomonas lundensis]|uniref:cytochrome c n=1 Tax=Serratia proteamaculans TaxID=28151 RepID=UPI00298170FC|nr:cytochrome c [Serratia proteamaculans]MDW5500825.1 cytochrome c [Serratia proteamaculans]MDW5505890.1 cytochrome c [Pseudomonas lundensis]
MIGCRQVVQGLCAFALGIFAVSAFAGTEDPQIIARGKYLAVAADCAACHRGSAEHDAPYVGGYAIASPMGKIIASNITPAKETGISNYNEQDFRRALTQGIRRDGQPLYPAMPYSAYQGLSDADLHALYRYFMVGVTPVERALPATQLDFPFSWRYAILGWNWLFLNNTSTHAAGANERGRYLVDVLGHCSACHSPRNWMMAERGDRYLAGGEVGGWIAPNITSDPVSGIGGWSQTELVQYLRTGRNDKAQAAGGMAEAVEHSLRLLSDDDLTAIADWLKQTPPITTVRATKAAYQYQGGGVDSASGAALYAISCASCHRLDAKGAYDGHFPALRHNSTVGSEQANNLVMVILHGVKRQGENIQTWMPGFVDSLDDRQVAELGNYVLQQFGNPAVKVTPAQVAQLRAGGETPLLIRLLPYLLWGGLLLVLLALGWLIQARRRRTR